MTTTSGADAAGQQTLGQRIDALVSRRRGLRNFARYASGRLHDAGAKLDKAFPGVAAAEGTDDATRVNRAEVERTDEEATRMVAEAGECRQSLVALQQELQQARQANSRRLTIGVIVAVLACLLLYAVVTLF